MTEDLRTRAAKATQSAICEHEIQGRITDDTAQELGMLLDEAINTLTRLQEWKTIVENGGDIARDRFVAGQYLAPVVESWKTKVAELEDTITAQSQLLALAQTLAGAANSFYVSQDQRSQDALIGVLAVWDAAQAEYQATGAVPCGECERLGRLGQIAADALVSGAKHMGAEMDELRAERDDLRCQLAEAILGVTDPTITAEQLVAAARLQRETLHQVTGQLAEAQADASYWRKYSISKQDANEALAADNAALVEALDTWGTHSVIHGGKCAPYCEICRIKTQPHPGAPMLTRMADLEWENEGLMGLERSIRGELDRDFPDKPHVFQGTRSILANLTSNRALQRIAVKRAAKASDAIRNRKEPSDEQAE